VASRCGYTKQYKQLREIYEKYESRGFVILGFPCNQFAGQEPGTNEEILFFCETKFSVNFPMFAKIDVKGEKAIPLFKYLTSDNPPFKDQGPVKWNFEKFLFNRKGEVVARYRSRTTPDDPQVIAAIEAALAEEAPTGEKKILESQDNKKMEKRSEENPTTEQKNAQTGEINE
jgi:glutathione peroxidase